MSLEKYRNPPQLAPLFNATKDSIVDNAKAQCEVTRAILDKLVAEVDVEHATFRNVLLPIEQDYDQQGTSIGARFYGKVAPDPALRKAAAQAQKLRQNFNIECSMREDVFRLVDAVFDKKEEALDAESQRILEHTRRGYIRSGLALPSGPARDHYKAISKRLGEIKTDYARNLAESTGGIWFSPDELDGLPHDVLEGLEKGTGHEAGKLRVTFKNTDYGPLMKFANRSETRMKVYIGRQNRVGFAAVLERPDC
jgi:metallopeptidase MepB